MRGFESTKDIIQESERNFESKREKIILEQLSDLINRGLLEIQSTVPVITRKDSPENSKVELEISSAVRLVLKDREYIEKLEKENGELKAIIEALKCTFEAHKPIR